MKRGISDIVVVVLIILLAISGVGIIWNFLSISLEDGINEGNDKASTINERVILREVTQGNSDGTLIIKLGKEYGSKDVVGIFISLETLDGNMCSQEIKLDIKTLEKKEIILQWFNNKEDIENVYILTEEFMYCLNEPIRKIITVPIIKVGDREIPGIEIEEYEVIPFEDIIFIGGVPTSPDYIEDWNNKLSEFEQLYNEVSTMEYGVEAYTYDSNICVDGCTIFDVNDANFANRLPTSSSINGNKVLFRAGAEPYRLNYPIVPRAGQMFYAEPGAILSGAVLIDNNLDIKEENNYYVIENVIHDVDDELLGELYTDDITGEILAVCSEDVNDRGCVNPQDLYIDDVMLYEVPSLSEVSQGKYYVDYNLKKIYFVDDYMDKRVEVSKLPFAFFGSNDDVTIRGFIIEKFASQFQYSAIQGTNVQKDCMNDVRKSGNNRNRIPYDGSCANYGGVVGIQKNYADDWSIENNEVRWNHAIGITLSDQGYMKGNKIHHNGQKGLASSGDDLQIIENEVYENPWVENGRNVAGFTDKGNFTSMGGMKLNDAETAILMKNYFHNNNHVGMWTDGYNIDITYDSNVVVNNSAIGISHEISHDAVIRGNYVKGNGMIDTFLGDSGIMIHNSDNVEIYGNYVSGNGNGIGVKMQNRGNKNVRFDEPGDDCEKCDAMGVCRLLHSVNISIHHNYIDVGSDSRQRTGMVASKNFECNDFKPWTEYLNPDNVKFTNNRYIYSNPNNNPFSWGNSTGISYSSWKTLGQS